MYAKSVDPANPESNRTPIVPLHDPLRGHVPLPKLHWLSRTPASWLRCGRTHHATITAHTERPSSSPMRTLRCRPGGVAKRRLSQNGPDRAIGVAWTPHSSPAVWVAIIDDIHNTMVEGLTEHRLDSVRVLYQRLDFPWPLNDRQWVIEIANDPSLAKATDGQVWSRHWAAPRGHRRWPIRNPTLDGGWLAIDVAEALSKPARPSAMAWSRAGPCRPWTRCWAICSRAPRKSPRTTPEVADHFVV